MSSSPDFIQFISDQVRTAGDITYKKMFGEYMLYCDGRPVVLVCDDVPYVKINPTTDEVFAMHGITPDIGTPYKGAKPHYILDIDNVTLATEMVCRLTAVTPLPKKRTKK